jgi:hypothetical protein
MWIRWGYEKEDVGLKTFFRVIPYCPAHMDLFPNSWKLRVVVGRG